jgi:hypothetical protein
LAKASLVGANTVNGPLLLRVSTSPAALTAATRVVWSFELTAFSTMVFVGYIAAPPTIVDAKGGKASISIADVMQSNGVIHVVDSVLMP